MYGPSRYNTLVTKYGGRELFESLSKNFNNLRVYMSLNFKRLKALNSGSVCSSGLLYEIMRIAFFCIAIQFYVRYLICPIIIYRKACVK